MDGYTIDGKAITTLNGFDISTILANIEVPTASGASSIEYLSHDRIDKILKSVGWKLYQTSNGTFYQQAVLSSGRSVRDELEVTAESEGGRLYTSAAGRIIYRGRSYDQDLRKPGLQQTC